MSVNAFISIMLVCIYLAVIAQNMENGAVVWASSVTLFVVLLIRVAILMVKVVFK